jgi:hypothetical protein
MAVRVAWDDEADHAIRYDFEGHWTWDEFQEAYDDALQLLAGADHTVHVIANLLPSVALPRGILEVVRRVADNAPPNHGMTVYVGEREVLQAFARAFERIYPVSASRYPLEFCATLAEARARLKTGGMDPGVG